MSPTSPIVYRFWIDVNGGYEEEITFDSEPSDQDLNDTLNVIYANHFPGGWERLTEPDNGSPTPCIVDDEGGVCGRDECSRCGATSGSSQGPTT